MKTLLSLLALTLVHIPLLAQEAPRAGISGAGGAAAPGGGIPADDPFARAGSGIGGGPASGDSVTPPVAVHAAMNLITTVETWSLSQADFLALLDESPAKTLPYERVRQLAETKKARLESVIAGVSKSFQRFVVESIDEVPHPIAFDPPIAEGEIAFPTSFQTRNVGESLEAELTVGPDGKLCDVSMVLGDVRLAAFLDHRSERTSLPVPLAQFEIPRFTTSSTVTLGETRFISTATRSAPVSPVSVVFLRINPETLPSTKTIAPLPGAHLRIDLMLFSLDRGVAQGLLLKHATSAGLYAAVRAAMDKGDAELERTGSISTKSGDRCVLEQVAWVTYVAERTVPDVQVRNGGEGPAKVFRKGSAPSVLEHRSVGLTLEIEPIIGPDGSTIDINLVPQVVTERGMLKFPPAFGLFPSRPVFETRKVTTSLSVRNGEPGFVGTMSLPRENGVNDRQDTGKTVLAFVRAAIVQP